ncbi:MAG TPA: hypothetical protein VEZ89_10700 [Rubrivivax sp.]|nr:hypothetical protein [Rubrivivax sp.]
MEQNRKGQRKPREAQHHQLDEQKARQTGGEGSPTSLQHQQQAGQQLAADNQLEPRRGQQRVWEAGQQGEQSQQGGNLIQMSGRSGQGAQQKPMRRGEQDQD